MSKPWADLTSSERLDAVLLAIAKINDGATNWQDATGNTIAVEVGKVHPMELPRSGNHGTGNVARQMSEATRVTPALTALRKRGLIQFSGRLDGRSGSADWLTEKGEARVREIRGEA